MANVILASFLILAAIIPSNELKSGAIGAASRTPVDAPTGIEHDPRTVRRFPEIVAAIPAKTRISLATLTLRVLAPTATF